MSDYISVSNKIINDITNFTKKSDETIAGLIRKLAEHIEKGLNEKNPQAINQAKLHLKTGRGYSKESADPTSIKNISKIIYSIKDKYFPSVSQQYIIKVLPSKYKEPHAETEKTFDLDSIPDSALIDKGDELIHRYKKLTNLGPAKDIKIKKSVEGIKNHDYNMNISSVLHDIIINLETDYELAKEEAEKGKTEKLEELKAMDKEIANRLRTAADKRHATDVATYEAILIASSTYDSLNNSTKYQTEILSRWELFDREKSCRKCYNNLSSCRADKCSCACHESVKRLTTKGLKWAKKHNPELEKLDKQLERLSEWEDDICSFGKILIKNAHVDDFMTPKQKRNLLARHIDKDQCEQCEFFLEDKPNFFEDNN